MQKFPKITQNQNKGYSNRAIGTTDLKNNDKRINDHNKAVRISIFNFSTRDYSCYKERYSDVRGGNLENHLAKGKNIISNEIFLDTYSAADKS